MEQTISLCVLMRYQRHCLNLTHKVAMTILKTNWNVACFSHLQLLSIMEAATCVLREELPSTGAMPDSSTVN